MAGERGEKARSPLQGRWRQGSGNHSHSLLDLFFVFPPVVSIFRQMKLCWIGTKIDVKCDFPWGWQVGKRLWGGGPEAVGLLGDSQTHLLFTHFFFFLAGAGRWSDSQQVSTITCQPPLCSPSPWGNAWEIQKYLQYFLRRAGLVSQDLATAKGRWISLPAACFSRR